MNLMCSYSKEKPCKMAIKMYFNMTDNLRFMPFKFTACALILIKIHYASTESCLDDNLFREISRQANAGIKYKQRD